LNVPVEPLQISGAELSATIVLQLIITSN